MGNIGAKLLIQISNHSTAFSGSTITGVIYLAVEKPYVECAQLRIKFEGTEKAVVQYDETTGSGDNKRTERKTATEYHTFFRYDDCVHNFSNGRVEQGRYEYPFTINLPTDLPSSFDAHDCSIHYNMEVRLDRPGWTKWDVVDNIPITIQKPYQSQTISPIQCGPMVTAITYFCCYSTGNMYLAGLCDKNVAVPGDELKFYYHVKNGSTTNMKALSITVTEYRERRAHGHFDTSNHTVFTRRIEANDLPGSDRDTTCNIHEYLKGENIEEFLRRNDKYISWNVSSILPDHSGRLVKIYHTLEMKIHTPMCCTNVETNNTIFAYSLYDKPNWSTDNQVPVPAYAEPVSIEPVYGTAVVVPTVPSPQQDDNMNKTQLPSDWTSSHVIKSDPVNMKFTGSIQY